MDFHTVELRCLCQASEDLGRVRRAVAVVLGVAGSGDESAGSEAPRKPPAANGADSSPEALEAALKAAGLAEEHTRGQFRNPIVILTCRLKRNRDIRAFWSALARTGPETVARLACDADERMDEELTFHFRLDKQEAYMGRLLLSAGGDTIAVRCKPGVYSGGRKKAVQDMGAFLEGLVAQVNKLGETRGAP